MDKFKEVCALSCDDWLDGFSQSYEYEFSDSFNKNMQKLADRMRNDKYHVFTRKAVYALIIAAVILSFATTVFALSSSREYNINIFSNHSEYNVFDTKNAGVVDNLNVNYVPTGFKKVEDYGYMFIYENGDKNFAVEKCEINTTIGFDTEEYPYENLVINGVEAIYFKADDKNAGIIFNNGDYIFIISGNIDKEELVKIAQDIE